MTEFIIRCSLYINYYKDSPLPVKGKPGAGYRAGVIRPGALLLRHECIKKISQRYGSVWPQHHLAPAAELSARLIAYLRL